MYDELLKRLDDYAETWPGCIPAAAAIRSLQEKLEAVRRDTWQEAIAIAERFGVNEPDRRKFGNEMAELFSALTALEK